MSLPPIDVLNALPAAGFSDTLRALFENAPSLCEALVARRPFTSYAQLIDTAEALTSQFSLEDKIATVNAHPRIGERTTSALSAKEQGAEASHDVDAALKTLNATYEHRLGFRFVVFVNRRPRHEILEVLKARMNNPRDQELHTAIDETFRIARDRLRTLNES